MVRAFGNTAGDLGSLAGLRRVEDGAGMRLAAFGAWTVAQITPLERQLADLAAPKAPALPADCRLDLSGLERLDTAGAWLVCRLRDGLLERGCRVELHALRREHQLLIDEVARCNAVKPEAAPRPNPITEGLASIGGLVDLAVRDMAGLIAFLGVFIAALFATLTFQARFRWTAFAHHLEHAGLRATPIIALICFLVGAVVMQQGALQLATYGAEPYAASMLGVLALREVGVLLTAVMVAGRSASAFTAEIGSMKMREEIDAMRTLGIDPVETLVVPRILALLVALPLLTFVGDIMCLAGGAAVAVLYLDQSLATFLERLHDAIEPRHFIAGMIKTPFAALVIGLVGCSEGLKVAGSAESLGRHVTSAVVKAIFLVIILGAVFAMFLVSIGI